VWVFERGQDAFGQQRLTYLCCWTQFWGLFGRPPLWRETGVESFCLFLVNLSALEIFF